MFRVIVAVTVYLANPQQKTFTDQRWFETRQECVERADAIAQKFSNDFADRLDAPDGTPFSYEARCEKSQEA